MATTADIQIKVGGLDKLQKFREQLWESNKILKKIKEDNLNTFNKLTGTIGELNRSLQIATENLANVKQGIKAQKDEVANYVTALGQFNKAQADQNRLIQNEINLREQQAAALKRVKDNSITALPSRKSSTFVQETISKGRSARIARERSAFLLGFGRTQYSGPIGPGPASPTELSPAFIGPRQATSSQQQAAITQAAKEMRDVYASLDKIQEKRLQQLADESQFLGGTRTKLQDIQKLTQKIRSGESDRPIGPETARRAGLKKGLSQFADFGLGAGFPLLFGGGAGQVAGGGIGTALGKSLGLASQAVFGLQIAFSAVGQQIEQAIRRIVEMQGAIANLDMDRLAETTLYVDQNLRSAVNGLVKAGQYADAYALATETAAMQTGLIGSQQENIAGTANYLGNSWNRLVTSGSAFLSIVGAPLAAALGGVVDLIGFAVKGINMMLSGIGELITRIPGVKPVLDLIKNATYQVTEEQAKQLAQAEQQTDSLRSQAALDNKLLELEKQRVAVVDSSIPGAQAIADLNNANIDLAQRNLEIDEELRKKQGKINEKYAYLVNLKGEALDKGESLKRQELALVESTANRQREEARLNDERTRGQIALKEENRLINEAISKLEYKFQLTQKTRQLELNEISNTLRLAEARYGTEKQLLSNQIQQAQAAGNSNKVYQLKIKLAQLDYDIAVQRINAEVRKLEIAKQLAKAKAKQLEVAVLQTVEGSKEETRLKRAVALQFEVVKQATANLSRGKELAKEQIRGAQAVKEGAIAAAKAARSAAENAESTRTAAQASGRYADNMQRAFNAIRDARSLSRLTGGLGQKSKVYTTTGTISIKGASQEAIAQAGGLEQFNQFRYLSSSFSSALSQWNQFADKVLTIDKQLSASGATRTPAYASGGYVSSPTNAMIGEGGSEYVIPASKMSAAMERYAAGKRGDAVVPNGNDTQVNVSTGPVMQMNGQNYVTQSDFEKGLRSTVNQVMTTLRRSPNTRAAVGI